VNVVRVPVEGLVSGRLRLDPRTSKYLARVRRLGVGSQLRLFDPVARLEADAQLAVVDERGVEVLVGELNVVAIGGIDIRLIQCVGKGAKLDEVVRDATELGVRAIQPATSERTVVERSGEAVQQRLARVAVEAARQSGRSDVPEIAPACDFDRALRENRRDTGLILHPRAARSLVEVVMAVVDAGTSFDLVIGPEGGFSDAELSSASALGYTAVRLGRTTLRTETAATAALGALIAFCDRGSCGSLDGQ
jgi:16S rRNA (uracil1498-N3)-methyltransferase